MKKTILTTSLVLLGLGLFAQVGINTDGSSPDTSALLDVKSTKKGMLVPRMSTDQRTAISNPATGLLVFDETTGGFWFYNGSIWEDLSAGDNLGNHTATQTLDLNGNNISAADSIFTTTLDVTGNLHLHQTTATGSGTGLVMVDGNRFIHSYGSGNFFAGKNAGNLTGSGLNEGHYNTAIGDSALTANYDGEVNTAVGNNALFSNTSGSRNTAVGGGALSVNQDGNFITAVGFNSGVSAQGLTNATAIGANAKVNSSNKIQLGDKAVTLVETAGTVNATAFIGDGSGLTHIPGDNLGNHTATQAFDLNTNNITNGDTVTATAFVGDGSGLTGIAGDNLGNHTATQVLNLKGNWLSGDGDSEGVFVANSGNVGIGTTSPDSSAQFEVSSTSKGFLSPRMTETQRDGISRPAAGLLIFQTNEIPGYYYYTGTDWIGLLGNGSGGNSTSALIDCDGNAYLTITIGNQVWMAENLRVTHYRNGVDIPNVTDNTTWAGLRTDAYCWYDNDQATNEKYGAIYNWYAVDDANGLCPEGWHVPTNAEWTALTIYLEGTNVAGGKMKVISDLWADPNTDATNSSSFSGLPGGLRYVPSGTFTAIGETGAWWSSTEGSSVDDAWSRGLTYASRKVHVSNLVKQTGLSVRCLRD